MSGVRQYFHNFLTLLKIGESGGKATFEGAEIGGGAGTDLSSILAEPSTVYWLHPADLQSGDITTLNGTGQFQITSGPYPSLVDSYENITEPYTTIQQLYDNYIWGWGYSGTVDGGRRIKTTVVRVTSVTESSMTFDLFYYDYFGFVTELAATRPMYQNGVESDLGKVVEPIRIKTDNDPLMVANSDSIIPSQKAIKAYVDFKGIAWNTPYIISTASETLKFGFYNIISPLSIPADYIAYLPAITPSDYGKQIGVEVSPTFGLYRLALQASAGQTIDGLSTRYFFAKENVVLVATPNGWTKIGGKNLPQKAKLSSLNADEISAGIWQVWQGVNNTLEDSCGLVDTSGSFPQFQIRRSGLHLVELQAMTEPHALGYVSNMEFTIGTDTMSIVLMNLAANMSSMYNIMNASLSYSLEEGQRYCFWLYVNPNPIAMYLNSACWYSITNLVDY